VFYLLPYPKSLNNKDQVNVMLFTRCSMPDKIFFFVDIYYRSINMSNESKRQSAFLMTAH